jgi:hypothetical protein
VNWARYLIPVLLVVSVIGAYLARGPTVKRSHGPCLVHGDCPSSERCLVVPAADGFATPGACVDPCEADLQCPQQQRCERFVDAKDHWLQSPSKGAPSVGGCVAGARAAGDAPP